MNNSKAMLAMGVGVAAMLLLSGCSGGTMVYRSTAAPTAYGYNDVPPPPEPRSEAVPPSPGPNYAWVGGYWDWTGSEYVWVPGYWTVPPTGTTRWVSPRYESRDGGVYVYYRGYWDRDDWREEQRERREEMREERRERLEDAREREEERRERLRDRYDD
ncbi:MAG: YXWGXW repeat-containing protein [Planctomycetaceae bacterium]|nr:hypothetical protein [Planctomycetaceae bacterium]